MATLFVSLWQGVAAINHSLNVSRNEDVEGEIVFLLVFVLLIESSAVQP